MDLGWVYCWLSYGWIRVRVGVELVSGGFRVGLGWV